MAALSPVVIAFAPVIFAKNAGVRILRLYTFKIVVVNTHTATSVINVLFYVRPTLWSIY